MTLESKYVNEECLQEWKGSNAGFKVADPVPMGRFLYELCCAVVRGDLPTPKCKAALDSVVFVEEQQLEDMSSVLADTIAHMGQDTKWLVDSSLVPSRLLQERCEEDFLWESDLSKIKGPDLKMKEVRVNTRLLYQQTKFNLLREESEGYAKLEQGSQLEEISRLSKIVSQQREDLLQLLKQQNQLKEEILQLRQDYLKRRPLSKKDVEELVIKLSEQPKHIEKQTETLTEELSKKVDKVEELINHLKQVIVG
ncbi:hypothetical protein ZIOFF_030855 [Zingiber officinale]|uniref:THO complex subunit 2 N-terminal domain-containing protein n=1 Tax=Zingiber officinale TaxID=94328 RepID=A0A8J5LC48_ZINOF|nr:hypothetical protein ZIOFF_030855 [Zingiber officinale]